MTDLMRCMNKRSNIVSLPVSRPFGKRGSVTIEAAIAFTITVVFIASMISVTVFVRSDILMQRAVTQTCRKVSLATPLSTPLADAISTTVNALPDTSGDVPAAILNAGEILAAAGAVDEVSGGSISELIMDGLLSRRLQNDIVSEYREMNGGSDLFMPGRVDVDFDVSSCNSAIGVYVTYETYTILGKVSRNIYEVIPVYGELKLFLCPQVRPEEDDSSVWDLDNFTRGEYFADEYGGNLPGTFPVINSFENGQATGITSMDLTSPWYSRRREIERRMRDEIDDLSEFDGAHWAVDGISYDVPEGSITSRVLRVIIPENSPEDSAALVESYRDYAMQRGVDLEITRTGVSSRYGQSVDPSS